MKLTDSVIIAQHIRESVTSLGLPEAGVKDPTILDNSSLGQVLGLVLPMIILLGLLVLVGLYLMNVEFRRPKQTLIYRFFFLFLISYFIWLAHFSLHVPFFFSIEMEYGIILGAGSVLLAGMFFLDTWLENREPFIKGAEIHCPKCHTPVPKVDAQCPKCGADLESGKNQ